jgi:hypothetical protein
MGMPPPRSLEKKTLVFDRPFALLLCDQGTGALLSAGIVCQPSREPSIYNPQLSGGGKP